MRQTDADILDSQALVERLEAAVCEHYAWLQRLNRSLLFGDMAARDIAGHQAHLECRFGAWLERNRGRGLLAQPAFEDLEARHEALHRLAARLDDAAQLGREPNGDVYDRVNALLTEFAAQATRIAAAFRRVESDLDPLTGLGNRRTMRRDVEREIMRAERSGQPCAVAVADLDHFKRINDAHGHLAGDVVLSTAAGRFLRSLRPYDSVYRFGGEEFVLCLPNSDARTAGAALERSRAAIAAEPIRIDDDLAITVTVSIGVAATAPGESFDAVLERADSALYKAKRGGRDRIVVWAPLPARVAS